MPKERERDLKNDKIHQIDEFLKNVREGGFWRNDLDNTPFSELIAKYYRNSKENNRYSYYMSIIDSIKDSKIRDSIGTDRLFSLKQEERYAIEDIAKELVNYYGSTISYATNLMTRSYINSIDKFRSKEEVNNENGYIVEANAENKMKESDLISTLAVLDGFESTHNFEQEFSNSIGEDMITILSSYDVNDPERRSLLQVIAMAEFGFNAIRILDKLSRTAKKLNPMAKEDFQDMEDGFTIPSDVTENKSDKTVDDVVKDIKDLVDDIYNDTNTSIDKKGIEDILYKVSPGVISIAKLVIDKKYPVSVQQKEAANLDTAAQLLMGMPSKDNGFKNVGTQLAFNYILASCFPKHSMNKLAEEYYDLIAPPKSCEYKDFTYKVQDAFELGLDLQIGEIILWKLIAEESNYGLEYESYAREVLCGNNPIVSLKSIDRELGKYKTDEIRAKDITNMLSGRAQNNYKTQVKSEMADFIVDAYRALSK